MKKSMAGAALAGLLMGGMAGQAQAVIACYGPGAYSSVTTNADGSFHYDVNVNGASCASFGDTQYVQDFYVPYFTDMAISNVSLSAGWSLATDATNDLFGLGGGVLSVSSLGRSSSTYMSFSFDSIYAGVKAPFETRLYIPSLEALSTFRGDPLVPGSPMTVVALGAAVPEPSTIVLTLLGLGLIAGATRRRR